MNDCKRFHERFEAWVAGDLPEGRVGELLPHAQECADCRGLLELHRDLASLADRMERPDDGALAAMRARVHDRVGSRPGVTATTPTAEIARKSTEPAGAWWRLVALPAAAMVVFAVGLMVGQVLRGSDGADPTAPAIDDLPATSLPLIRAGLVDAAQSEAASNVRLEDVDDSGLIFSNVSFRRLPGNRVELGFDVTTHVEVIEPADSELVREMLVHSMLNPTSTGARLRALESTALSRERLAPKVRDSLIFAMRNDESLAVRMRALEILATHVDDPAVEESLLATLRDDAVMQIRMLALEAVAPHTADTTRIREAISQEERDGDAALLLKLNRYEQRM